MRWCGLRDFVRSMDGGSSAGAGMRDGSVTERLVDSYPSVEASQLQGLKPCRGCRGHMRVQRTWGTDEAVEDMGDRGGWRQAVGWSSDDCLPLHPPTEIQAGAIPGVAASCRRERWSTAAVEDCSLLCLSYLALAWPTTPHR